MVPNLDLNIIPDENWMLEGTSWFTLGAATIQHQGTAKQSCAGLSSSPIDLEEIDDDIQMLPSSGGFPQVQAPNQTRRNNPVTEILDEDLELNLRPSGLSTGEPVLTLSVNSCKHQRTSGDKEIVDCDLLLNLDYYNAKRKNVTSQPEPIKATPTAPLKEPSLACPVCMDALVEPSSTICGHIFCRECIKVSIQKLKKCPTCRKKLTRNNYHRIYLPTTTDE